MKISKETKIGYVVVFIVAAIVCWVNKLNWWVLAYFPMFYFILWLSIKEKEKQDKKRKENKTHIK